MKSNVLATVVSFVLAIQLGCNKNDIHDSGACMDSLEYDFLRAYLIAYETTAIQVYVPDFIEAGADTFTLTSHGVKLLVGKDRDDVFNVTGGDFMIADVVEDALAKVTIYRHPNVSIASGYLPVARLVSLKFPNYNSEKVVFFDAQKRRLKRELKEVKRNHHLSDEQFDQMYDSFVQKLIDK